MAGERTEEVGAFGKEVLSQRQYLRLGLRKAGKLVGISPTTLCRIERGRVPSLEVYYKVCVYFGLATDDWIAVLAQEQGWRDDDDNAIFE